MENKLTRLQIAIAKRGLDQAGIAARTGYAQSAVSRILNAKTAMTPQFMKIFCHEFNISESWLAEGKGEMSQPDIPDISSLAPEALQLWELVKKLSAKQARRLIDLADTIRSDD